MGAPIVIATVVGNLMAVHAAGAGRLRNRLLTGNGTAAAGDAPSALASAQRARRTASAMSSVRVGHDSAFKVPRRR
jgi:hypothetical protein